MNRSRIATGNNGREAAGRPAGRGPVLFVVLLWMALPGLSGCMRLAPKPPKGSDVEGTDPYANALQQALVRQNLQRVQTGTQGYRIGPNDIVEIRVFGYDKMNTTARVGGNGCINFPPLGEVRAEGLTDRQLEAVLEDRLRGHYLREPHVTVFIKELNASEVAIVGQVQKPGQYLLMGEKRLVDLLTEAGGMTPEAGSVAYVIRFEDDGETSGSANGLNAPGGAAVRSAGSVRTERIRIDLDGLLLRAEEQWNIVLEAGDLVNIPEAGSVHVTGTGVKKPGTYKLTRLSKTLRQIIDEAEGLKFEASQKLVLLRKEEDGTETSKPVDYRKIRRDSRNDLILQSGDVVLTKRTPIKTGLGLVGKAFTTLIRIGIYGSWSVPI